MIKNFEEYINEDYFSKLANRKDNGSVRKENELTEEFVLSYHNSSVTSKRIKSVKIYNRHNKQYVDIVGDFCLKPDTTEIPFQFGKVDGDFDCSYCHQLTSLKGCPEIVTGTFECSNCENLKSLEGAPWSVGEFDCYDCTFKDLTGAPREVFGRFICVNGELTSLKGCPEKIGGSFACGHNNLTSLEFGPKEVGGTYTCKNNPLVTLKGCPEIVPGNFSVTFDNEINLDYFPKEVHIDVVINMLYPTGLENRKEIVSQIQKISKVHNISIQI